MSEVSVKLDGDVKGLLERLKSLSDVDKAEVMRAIAEGLRTSTIERFRTEKSPEGVKWEQSARAKAAGGKTLTKSAALRNSVKAKADSKGASVGTNLVYAATHQLGAERTIRAKNVKNLKFKVGNRWVSKQKVSIEIPARPFLGISDEDMKEIRHLMIEAVTE